MNLPSDKYFFWIDDEQSYKKFRDSGLMWEMEPHAPWDWKEHLELKKYWVQVMKEKGYNVDEEEGFERSSN